MTFETGLYGLCAVISLGAVLVFATAATFYVVRLLRRPSTDSGEAFGTATAVMKKVRTRQRLNDDEASLARRIIADRRSPLAFAIPAALFSVGCFFVFGSLEQLHGAAPSERTFLGIFPMLTATNLAVQLMRSARLKTRVRG